MAAATIIWSWAITTSVSSILQAGRALLYTMSVWNNMKESEETKLMKQILHRMDELDARCQLVYMEQTGVELEDEHAQMVLLDIEGNEKQVSVYQKNNKLDDSLTIPNSHAKPINE